MHAPGEFFKKCFVVGGRRAIHEKGWSFWNDFANLGAYLPDGAVAAPCVGNANRTLAAVPFELAPIFR